MNKDNYRGTGLSKEEIQAQVDVSIKAFKKAHPDTPVPEGLLHWVENIADEKDVAMAKKRMLAMLVVDKKNDKHNEEK